MRATIQRAGGVGGMRVGGTIDTAELGGELAARAAEVLSPKRLAAAASAEAEPGAADLHTYEVSLDTGQSYTITGETGDVAAGLDELVNEIIRRRRGQ